MINRKKNKHANALIRLSFYSDSKISCAHVQCLPMSYKHAYVGLSNIRLFSGGIFFCNICTKKTLLWHMPALFLDMSSRNDDNADVAPVESLQCLWF